MKALVIGASGVVGSAAAEALRNIGWEVLAASRSGDLRVDTRDEASIRALFEQVGEVDAVACAAGGTVFKPVTELTHDDFVTTYLGKAQSQIDLVRIGMPYVRDGGSFTLTSGILVREPIRASSAAAAANGALEAFVKSAATELPRSLRINAVSPSVLAESPGYHASFPGFPPVPAAAVGQLFVRSACGVQTGRIFTLDRP